MADIEKLDCCDLRRQGRHATFGLGQSLCQRGRAMELPIVAPAPVVTERAEVFRNLFDNHCQFRHFQHYLTGLIDLPNESMANIARCILDHQPGFAAVVDGNV